MHRPTALLIIALPFCLGACASPASYPSLSKREAERATGTAEPAVPDSRSPEAPPPSAELQTKVERLLKQARTAHGEFEAASKGTRRAISAARDSTTASESWVRAHVALTSLEAARSGAITALSEIDQLYADERVAKPEAASPSAALLGTARGQIKAWIEEESTLLVQLANQLGG